MPYGSIVDTVEGGLGGQSKMHIFGYVFDFVGG